MREAFSYSLSGNNPRYTSGVSENLKRITAYNPNAFCILHIDSTVKVDTSGWNVITHPKSKSLESHFWRFETAGYDTFDIVHVRDIDSLFNSRDVAICSHIKESGIQAYGLRDSEWHTPSNSPHPLFGGMWGIQPKLLPQDFTNLVQWWVKNKGPFERWADMWFLQRYVYPYVLRYGKVFSSVDVGSRWPSLPFPKSVPKGEHIGATHW